jgi:hypothetical protein
MKQKVGLMEEAEIKGVLDAKGFPRVTKDSIEAKIAGVEFATRGIMTLCFITMQNGFVSHGISVPASPENFDAGVGEHYAYENAFRPLWQLEGYLLRERLSSA